MSIPPAKAENTVVPNSYFLYKGLWIYCEDESVSYEGNAKRTRILLRLGPASGGYMDKWSVYTKHQGCERYVLVLES